MRNTILHGEAAASVRGWAMACARGTCLPGGVKAPLFQDRNVPASARPSTLKAAMAAQPTKISNYQDKTRIIAAVGGVSGSHPAWDPV